MDCTQKDMNEYYLIRREHRIG